jgi:uncharacterized protein (DUF2062 family)
MKRERLKSQWWLAPFGDMIHDPNLWVIRRRNVVPAFALGLFVAYLPFPGHMLAAALLAIALRVNIAVAVLSTWTINPLTMGPMYYLAFTVGQYLLGQEPRPFEFELSFEWLIDRFVYIWEPLILGCVLLGAILSLLGFVALDLLWRASISDYLARRRKRRIN